MPGMPPVILATPEFHSVLALGVQWEAVTQTRDINTKRFHKAEVF